MLRQRKYPKSLRTSLAGTHSRDFIFWEPPIRKQMPGYNTKDLSEHEILLLMFLVVECDTYEKTTLEAIVDNAVLNLKWDDYEVRKTLWSLFDRGLVYVGFWDTIKDNIVEKKIFSNKVLPKGYGMESPHPNLGGFPIGWVRIFVLTEPALELLAQNMRTVETNDSDV